MKKDNQNGITLIALVVTIIVLLILAGVSIAMLSGQNGILNRASEAAEANAIADAKSQIALTVAECITNWSDVEYAGADAATILGSTSYVNIDEYIADALDELSLDADVTYTYDGTAEDAAADAYDTNYGATEVEDGEGNVTSYTITITVTVSYSSSSSTCSWTEGGTFSNWT